MDIFFNINTIISLIASIITIYSALKARTYVNKAEKIYKKLQNKKELLELTALSKHHYKILNAFKKYGLPKNSVQLQGINIDKDCKLSYSYIEMLKKYSYLFEINGDNKTVVFCRRLEALNKNFDYPVENLQVIGREIYSILSDLSPIIHQSMSDRDNQLIR